MNLFPMRVLLISANLCEDPYPVYPLGISVIAGALSEEGHSVRQLDLAPCARDGSWKETLSEVYRTFRPGLIGLGIRNVDSVNSRDEKEESLLDFPLEVARFCKENFPEQLILGGGGFSLLPDLLLERSGADYAVAGEGEESVRELVRALEKGEKPVRHLLRGKRPLRQSAPLYQEDITEYYCRESHVIPLQSKRGCPFRCVYCSYPALEGRTIRARDPESVVRDMLFLHRKHPDAVLAFTDSVFNDPEGLFRDLLRTLKKHNDEKSIPFSAFLTPAGLTDEDAALLKECGLVSAELGVDAASDATLKAMGKSFSFREAAHACGLLTRRQIRVTTNLIFGGPGETWDTVREGIDNLLSLKNAFHLIFSGVRILPGTPLLELAKKEKLLPDSWDGLEERYYFATGIDPEKLHRILSEAFADHPFCIYPPHARQRELRMIHRIGLLAVNRFLKGEEKKEGEKEGEGGDLS